MSEENKRIVAEEVWEANGQAIVSGGHEVGALTVDRARIAACAPEALRMLLAMEWTGNRGWGPPCCPVCECFKPGEDREHGTLDAGETYGGTLVGHTPDCPWLALMRKAGLR